MMDLILLLQADIDIQEAFNRYDNYQDGRGYIFMQQLDAALTLVRLHPHLGGLYAAPFRRLLIRDFPYGVFYDVQPSRIIVVAIMDLRQRPRSILRKLLGK